MNEIIQSPSIGDQVEGGVTSAPTDQAPKQLADHVAEILTLAPDLMGSAIEARDAPEFERIFAHAKHVRSQAAVSEVLHRQEEKIENQRAAHEVRVDVERLLGEWLIEAEKSGLRFMGKPPKGKKIGTPSDPNLITLKRLGITKQQSRDWQKTARLSPAKFQALRADLSAGPTIVRFSATRSHQRRRDSGGGAGGLLAVPKSVPSTLRELAKLRRDIDKAETYKALRQIEQKAAALQKLYADIDLVRIEAGKVIVFANYRIGVELVKLPKAKGAAEKGTNRGTTRTPQGAASLKEQVGSKNRGLRLKKLGSQEKSVVEAVTEKLIDQGKDVTVNAVLKTIAAQELAKKRETSRTATPRPFESPPMQAEQLAEAAPLQPQRRGTQEQPRAEPKPDTPEQPADERKAFDARQQEQYVAQQDQEPDLPTYFGRSGRQLSLDERLGNLIFITEGGIAGFVEEMRAAGRLPELFQRLRKLIDKIEAEAIADAEVAEDSGERPAAQGRQMRVHVKHTTSPQINQATQHAET
jgi:hypothetical protein